MAGKIEDEKMMEALKECLEGKVPKRDYSIGVYSEDCVCIEEDNDKWNVYYACRNQKLDLRVFEDCKEACIYVINWLTKGDAGLILPLFERNL